jgi:hypothetical protein
MKRQRDRARSLRALRPSGGCPQSDFTRTHGQMSEKALGEFPFTL